VREIRALTSLRGFAALAVVMQHFSATAQAHAAQRIPSLVPHGYMAVDFFFVLSGFIMCYTYLNRFANEEPGAYGDFLVRRVARVVPLNVAVLLLIVAGGMASNVFLGHDMFVTSQRLWFDLPANLLMLQGLGIGLNMNGPSWSISIEFVAYLAFPLLVVLNFHRLASVRAGVLLVSIGALIALAISGADIGRETVPVVPALMRCFAEFSMGMMAFWLYRSGRFPALGSDETVTLLLGAVAFTLIMRVDLPASLLFPFVVVACARNRGVAATVLGSRVPYFLGLVSYSLYLMHNMFRIPLLALLRAVHPQPLETLPALGFALAGSLFVIPFAWFAYRMVERPGRDVVRLVLRARLKAA
jgi:peptidoglycan/LPS O-acetylase OafA/YrhL